MGLDSGTTFKCTVTTPLTEYFIKLHFGCYMELVASLDSRISEPSSSSPPPILELSYISSLASKYPTFKKGHRLAVISDREQMFKYLVPVT